jgi:hypothetical protein
LDQDIEDVPVLINGSPQIVILALDRQKHLIHVPLIAGPRTATTELISILLAELVAPFADGSIRENHAALKKQFFDIPEAQAETKVEPDGVADNCDRETVILIFGGRRRGVHAVITSYQTVALQASQEVDNARIRSILCLETTIV